MRLAFLFFILTLLLTALPSKATIFVVAYDEATGAMGTAVSSSGPAYFKDKRIQVREKGVGIASAGGMGHCRRATPRKFLQAGLSASEIAARIAEQCDRVEPYYRLAIVTANGEVHVHQGPNDCNKYNVHCAMVRGKHLGVAGGGLELGVAEAGFAHFQKLDKSLPLECRLHSTLEAIYAAGGETIFFKTAAIVVDYPERPESNLWQVKSAEFALLPNLQQRMLYDGVICPGWANYLTL